MELTEAKELLNLCDRWESRDHAFGDREVGWTFDGKDVADGYFGGGHSGVSIHALDGTISWSFDKADAYELAKCGATENIGRNDETGPDTFTEGYIMPGLTKEAVRKELTGE